MEEDSEAQRGSLTFQGYSAALGIAEMEAQPLDLRTVAGLCRGPLKVWLLSRPTWLHPKAPFPVLSTRSQCQGHGRRGGSRGLAATAEIQRL